MKHLAVAVPILGLVACGVVVDDPVSDPANAPEPAPDLLPTIELVPGVFSLSALDHPADPAVYTNPDVAGIAVRVAWDTLNPADGIYAWDFVDAEIAAAAAAGKHISVYLGARTPAWVFALGVRTFTFIDPGEGEEVTIAVPWDPIFLAKWQKFIRAFGARYAGEPTIAYVRGASESVTNGWGLATEDVDGNTWAAYGYTPEKLIAAMTRVLDTFMAAMPATVEWVEVGPIKFEEELSGNPEVYVAEAITAYGFARYPDRFAVWREDIHGCIAVPPTSEVWQILWEHPGRDGAQMLWNVQDGPDRMNKCGIAPNDKPTVLREAIERGLDYGMPYLEIYQVDVLDPTLGPVIHAASNRLGS